MRVRSMIMFGIGYLVGTRSGRDRSRTLVSTVRQVLDSDVVRNYVARTQSGGDAARTTRPGADATSGSPRGAASAGDGPIETTGDEAVGTDMTDTGGDDGRMTPGAARRPQPARRRAPPGRGRTT